MVKRLVPPVVFGIFIVYLAASALGPSPRAVGSFDLAGFRLLPVSVNGRVQPFDSVARMSLQRIRGSATVPLAAPAAGRPGVKALDPTDWLLEVLATPDAADSRPIFPIGEPGLRATLSLGPGSDGTGYYAFRALAPKVGEIGNQTERIAKKKEADRTAWERELLVLRAKLVAYERLKNSVQPNSLLQLEARGTPSAFDFAEDLAKYRSDLGEAVRVAERRRAGGAETLDVATEQRVRSFARRFEPVSRLGLVAMIPPPQPAEPRDGWQTTGAAIVSSARSGRLAPPVAYVAELASAFSQGRAETFNKTLVRYRRWLESNGLAREATQAGYEAFYNRFQPFVRATAVYGVGLILSWLASRTRSVTMSRSAQALIPLAFAVHTVGLGFTFVLAGRPSAITLAGWTTAFVALGLARWRRGAGLAAGALAGIVGLVAAYGFAPGGVSVLVRGVSDIGLLAALAATGVTLGAAGIATRLAGWRVGVARPARAAARRSRHALASR
jgi:hypothetical protein